MLQKFFAILLSIVTALSGLTGSGRAMMDRRVFEVTLDDATQEICDRIKAECGLDIEQIATNLPNLNEPVHLVNRTFHIDTVAFRDKMYGIRDQYNAQGNRPMALVFYFFGAYLSGFTKCDITLEPSGEFPGEYEFVLNIFFEEGTERLWSGAFYNPETGEFHGRNDQGMATIGFNFNLTDMLVYATVNCWMRDFGFCFWYDLFCYTTPFFKYRTRRFKFDYQGKEWMIQVWKGRYVITDGAEVGLYNRDKARNGTFYDCAGDDELLNMSFSLYHGDELLFSRAEQKHWWVNGFKLMRRPYAADELTLRFAIEMKDEDMLRAFCQALERNPYHDYTYTTDGLTVSIVW